MREYLGLSDILFDFCYKSPFQGHKLKSLCLNITVLGEMSDLMFHFTHKNRTEHR